METSVGIGELAHRFGMRTSTLRYYEERGLLMPECRDSASRRRYGDAQIRRLAFIRMCQGASLTLDEIGVLADGTTDTGRDWRDVVNARIRHLDEQIASARAAREFLTGSLRCPSNHPALECPYVHQILDGQPGVQNQRSAGDSDR